MKLFRSIVRWFRDPRHLTAVFLFVMLFPNVALAITEPYGISTVLASLLMPGGFYLLWSQAAARPGIMILAALPFMVLGAFQLVLLYLFGNSIIAVDMFTNVLTTSVSEAGELLSNIYPSIIFVCILYIPLVAAAADSIRRKVKSPVNLRKRYALAGICLLAAGGIFAGVSEYRNREFGIKYHVFPANVIYNIHVTIERWNKNLAYDNTSAGFTFDASRQKATTRREVYVLVIGEASRAYSWSLYGYERQTNPELSRTGEIVVFKDLITQSNTTHKSVPIILSSAAAENFDDIYKQKGICALFREAGFRTVFISNQPTNRSLIDHLAAEADRKIDIASRHSIVSEVGLDGEALPYIREELQTGDQDLFIVLHTYGSHVDYSKRYPAEFGYFLPDKFRSVKLSTRQETVNAYDNSIRYTDWLLCEIIGLLREYTDISAMLYCSDHGEDLLDNSRKRFLHASPTPTYYQLHAAALAWFSQGYENLYPDKSENTRKNSNATTSTASVFHTMGDMADIHSQYVNREFSLASGDYKEKDRLFLNDHDNAISVLDAGLTQSDFDMFDRMGIKYDRSAIRNIRY